MRHGAVATIACDESASEGENLVASTHPVFVHGSTDLAIDDAQEFIAALRAATNAQAREMKSSAVLRPRNRDALLRALTSLEGHGNIYFVDKSYFLTAKLIALTVAEFGERLGLDVHHSGFGRYMADLLHRDAEAAVGTTSWNAVLSTFNNVVRSYVREGSAAPAVEFFYEALADARKRCSNLRVALILEEVWEARDLIRAYEGATPVELRELDPIAPSLAAVSMTWHMRLGDVPFEFLHDTYSGLSPGVCKAIVASSRAPLALGEISLPRGDLRGIRLIDSKSDARVQVADILAGVGREVARMAAAGTFDDDLQTTVHQMLDFNVMSSGGSPLDRLVEQAPLDYFTAWKARGANRT